MTQQSDVSTVVMMLPVPDYVIATVPVRTEVQLPYMISCAQRSYTTDSYVMSVSILGNQRFESTDVLTGRTCK